MQPSASCFGTNEEDDFVINSQDFIELNFMSSYLYTTN